MSAQLNPLLPSPPPKKTFAFLEILVLKSPKRSVEDGRETVLWLLQRQPRILIGEACLAIGPYWRLKDAEALLEDMVTEGVLRHATSEENSYFGVSWSYVMV